VRDGLKQLAEKIQGHTSGAKALVRGNAFTAAVNRCATQTRLFHQTIKLADVMSAVGKTRHAASLLEIYS